MEPLKWHEPRDFRRARFYQSEKANPLAALKTVGISFLVLMGVRLLVEFGPRREGQTPPGWIPVVCMAIPVSIFIAYGLPFVLSFLCFSLVYLSEKGINNNIIGVGGTLYFWPWEAVGTFELNRVTLKGKEYQSLDVLDGSGNLLAELCLADPKLEHGIREWAEAKGIPVENGSA